MALVFAEHHDDGVADGTAVSTANTSYTGVEVNGDASIVHDTDVKKNGTGSIIVNSGSSQRTALTIPITGNKTWVRFNLRLNSLPTGNCGIFAIYDGANRRGYAMMTSSGTLRLRDHNAANLGGFTSAATSFAVGAWGRIEIMVNAATSTMTLRIFTGADVDGTTPSDEETGSYTYTGTFTKIEIGTNVGDTTPRAVSYNLDMVGVDDADWIGPNLGTVGGSKSASGGSVGAVQISGQGSGTRRAGAGSAGAAETEGVGQGTRRTRSGAAGGVEASGTGAGVRRALSGSQGGAEAQGEGSGLKRAQDGAHGTAITAGQGSGTRRNQAGSSGTIDTAGTGSGLKRVVGGSVGQVNVEGVGSGVGGTDRRTGGSVGQVTVEGASSGVRRAAGGSTGSVNISGSGAGEKHAQSGSSASVQSSGAGIGSKRTFGGSAGAVSAEGVGSGTRPSPSSGGSVGEVLAEAVAGGLKRVRGGAIGLASTQALGNGYKRVSGGAATVVTVAAVGAGYDPAKAIVRYITLQGSLEARTIQGERREVVTLLGAQTEDPIVMEGSLLMVMLNQDITDLFESETPVIQVEVPGDLTSVQLFRLAIGPILKETDQSSYDSVADLTTISFPRLDKADTAGRGGNRYKLEVRAEDASGNEDVLSSGEVYVKHSQFEEVS